jgi:hypothetical protein
MKRDLDGRGERIRTSDPLVPNSKTEISPSDIEQQAVIPRPNVHAGLISLQAFQSIPSDIKWHQAIRAGMAGLRHKVREAFLGPILSATLKFRHGASGYPPPLDLSGRATGCFDALSGGANGIIRIEQHLDRRFIFGALRDRCSDALARHVR